MEQYEFTLKYDKFSAELTLTGDWSLYDLAEFLIKTLGFQFDHSFEFCDNLKHPYKSQERYTLFADIGEEADENDLGVRNTLVADVFTPKKTMMFHFDYGDDWFFLIRCNAIKEVTAKRRSRKVISTTGQPPDQYPAWEEEDEDDDNK